MTRNPSKSAAFAAALFAASAVAYDAGAEATLLVLHSSSDDYARGQVLTSEDMLALQAGQALRLMAPSGATREIPGPTETRVADMPEANDPVTEGFERVLAYFDASGRDTRTLAARGTDISLDGWAYDREGGRFCFTPSSQPVRITRHDPGEATTLSVSSRLGESTAQLAADQHSVDWPGPVRGGMTFTVSFNPGAAMRVTFVSMRDAPSDPSLMAAAFMQNDCMRQFEQLASSPL